MFEYIWIIIGINYRMFVFCICVMVIGFFLNGYVFFYNVCYFYVMYKYFIV